MKRPENIILLVWLIVLAIAGPAFIITGVTEFYNVPGDSELGGLGDLYIGIAKVILGFVLIFIGAIVYGVSKKK